MLLAHWIAYYVAIPDGHTRSHALAATGHGYWPLAIALALGAAAFGAAAYLRNLRRSHAISGRRAGAWLAVTQILGFVALEVIERLAVGQGPLEVFGEPVLAIGICAQLLVAFAGALLLRGVASIVARVRGRRAAVRPVRSLALPNVPVFEPATRLVTSGFGLRGPPSASTIS